MGIVSSKGVEGTVHVQVKPDYIKVGAILRLGIEEAKIIFEGYSASEASDKLKFIDHIKETDISEGAKLKFIGDVIQRPKKERFAIARRLAVAIAEETKEK